jgi:hypothetical protein
MEKEEKAAIENIRQTVKMSNLQEKDFINLVKSDFDTVDLEFDQVYTKVDKESTKQCQELGSLSDRMFLEVVNDLFTFYQLTVMSFITEINARNRYSLYQSTIMSMCKAYNIDIPPTACSDYFQSKAAKVHGVHPVMNKNGIISVKLIVEILMPKFEYLGQTTRTATIGLPISHENDQYFYEFAIVPKTISMKDGKVTVIDECNTIDDSTFCDYSQILRSSIYERCGRQAITHSDLSSCEKKIYKTTTPCIYQATQSKILISSFKQVFLLNNNHEKIAGDEPQVSLIERSNAKSMMCGSNMLLLPEVTESSERIVVKDFGSIQSSAESWISQVEYIRIGKFAERSTYFNDEAYDTLARKTDQLVHEKLGPVYENLRPFSFYITSIFGLISTLSCGYFAYKLFKFARNRLSRRSREQEESIPMRQETANPNRSFQNRRRARPFRNYNL